MTFTPWCTPSSPKNALAGATASPTKDLPLSRCQQPSCSAWFFTLLVDEGPVEYGRLLVRLAYHEHEPGAGSGVRHRELCARTEQDQLRGLGRTPVRPEHAFPLQQVGEPLELRRHRGREPPAVG